MTEKSTYARLAVLQESQRDRIIEILSSASSQLRGEPIAVLGVSVRLPGDVSGVDDFDRLLTEGATPITETDPRRWIGDSHGIRAGFLSDPLVFDADFFGIMPLEAESLDPQQRLALEIAVEAIEDSGRSVDDLRGSATGLFLGIYHHDFEEVFISAPSPYAASGNAHSIAAGRLAYILDLSGPAISFDTACSTSLVAIHQAACSLAMRECDGAIVAGVNVMLSRRTHDSLESWGMLSPRARCSSFDVAADGFVRGEGAGAVYLKRLSDALRDGDEVLSVIRGSAINQDGRSQGLTAPSGAAQVAVIQQALANAGISAESVGYVETHGTGTALGDPIEYEALHETYGIPTTSDPCVLGAVKSNIGHLEAAAGIVGFIKAMLVLGSGRIPRNPGFERLNPHIPQRPTRLRIASEPLAWPSTRPRRAAVSSFGFGGTNAHVILEEGSSTAAWPRRHPRQWNHDTSWPLPGRGVRTPKNWFLISDLVEAPAEAVPLDGLRLDVRSASGVAASTLADALQALGAVTISGSFEFWQPDPAVIAVVTPETGHDLADLEGLKDEASMLAEVAARCGRETDHQILFATQRALRGPSIDPVAASWWGWARACALELGPTFAGAVDADDVEGLAQAVATHLGSDDGELFMVLREGRRLVPRLVPAPESLTEAGPASLREDRSYLVIGANGPVGLALLDYLTERGAKYLTLTGRGQPKEPLNLRMDALHRQGVDVEWTLAHADDPSQMRDVISSFGRDRPELDGVFLTAFAGGPCSLEDLTAEDVDAMYRPKVDAAVYLDRLTSELDLSIFALFSSTTGCLGSRQLAHYSGASGFLDGLAYHRRERGLPALAIDWGIWAGRLDETSDNERRHVEGSGLQAMDDQLAIYALDQLLAQNEFCQVMVADADWELVRVAYSTRTSFTLVDQLLWPSNEAEPEARGASMLAATPPRERSDAVVTWVRRVVANLMHLRNPEQLPVDKGLFDVGLDSLMSVQVQRALNEDFGVGLSPTVVYSHPTVAALASQILERLRLGGATEERRESARPAALSDDPIAIVGMACRFPRGESLDEFWTTLSTGRDAISTVPLERWDAASLIDPDPTTPGAIRTDRGGFLTGWDPTQFDAEFFGISPREAAALDPQQRLMLELAVETLNDAGLAPLGLQGTRTGVFVGITTRDYMVRQTRATSLEDIDAYTGTGSAANFAAGRVSYQLRLQGPAMAIDTACSSSLTALHVALGELRSGTCDAALVGGVNIMLAPDTSVSFTRWGMLSPRGVCASFDESADGFVRGEGAGMIMLKPLSVAVRDGDRVVAVLRGSSCGQDGESAGQTVPNGAAQSAVISDALSRSGLTADDIDFVETHGAGTAVGDPIELEALGEVFGDRTNPIIIGALKSVTGHMEAAAGIGGIIKTALALSHRKIPPNLHFERLTSQVTLRGSRVEIPTTLVPWPCTGHPARAGVSSFGASGTNVHVVLEEAPSASDSVTASQGGVWLFSGQGSQWDGMGAGLLDDSPAFAETITDLAPYFKRETGRALLPLLRGEAELAGIDLVQPAIFCMQVGLAATWRALGAEPSAVIGHSMGEVAAAVVAGALTAEDGMAVIARRSRLLKRIAGKGLMAMLEASESAAREIIRGHPGVDIAVLGSPGQTVVSGDPTAIRAITADFQARGLFAREIAVDVASHSPQADELLSDLRKELAQLMPQQPRVKFLSTVAEDPRFDADYWADNLRRPVRLMQSLQNAMATGETLFVEMSPHPLLGASVMDCADGRKVTFIPSMRRHDPSVRPNLRSPLPPVVWHRKRHWFETTVREGETSSLLGQHALTPSGEHVFTNPDLMRTAPWLSEHRVDGVPVMPLAGWAAMIVEAVDTIKGSPTCVEISGLKLHSAYIPDSSVPVTTSLRPVGENAWAVRIGSQTPSWQLHASAQVTVLTPQDEPAIDTEPASRAGAEFPVSRLYERLRSVGQQHSGIFAPITEAWLSTDGIATTHLRANPTRRVDRRARVFPPLLDGALQTLAVSSLAENSAGFVLPEQIGTIRVSGEFVGEATAWAKLTRDSVGFATGNVLMLAEGGRIDVSGIRLCQMDAPVSARLPLFDQKWVSLPGHSGPAVDEIRVVAEGPASSELAARVATSLGSGLTELDSTVSSDSVPDAVCVVINAVGRASADVVGCLMAVQRTVMTVLGWGLRDTPRVYCLVNVTPSGVLGQIEAALRAFCRVLAYEHPDLCASVVSFDASSELALASLVRSNTPETDVAFFADGARALRIQQVQAPLRDLTLPVTESNVVRAEVSDGEIAWVEQARPVLESGEVLVQVEAAGLNFSDVLKWRGAYPLHHGEHPVLGGEVAGTVVACGPDVTLHLGNKVFGLATGGIGTMVRTRADLLSQVPDGMSAIDAAALPVAYTTAVHCLDEVAHLRDGQTVVITSASGGVGLAAVAVARRRGARIIATAGTAEKREFLQELGLDDVLDSYALDLGEQIMERTSGVDVVLNTLTGSAFRQLLSTLRPGGRFVELSKDATFGHHALDLATLARGGSFSAVDLAYLMHHDRDTTRRLLSEVVAGLTAGWVMPLPTRTFGMRSLDEALSAFSEKEHRGKIVVTAEAGLEAQPPAGRVVRPNGAYLVTGAFSGLGWQTASWLAAQKPRRLVLNGRRPPDADRTSMIEEWRESGIEVEIVLGDVADSSTVSELVDRARAGGSLHGVIHSAGVVQDKTIRYVDEETIRAVLRPKLVGAKLILDAVLPDALDFCVLYSSAAVLLGSPGQGAYAVANAAMDSLAQQYADEGMTVQSINWGPWAQTGLATNFTTLGYHALSNAEGLDALNRIICSSLQRAGVFDVDARQWFQSYPAVSELPYFSDLEVNLDSDESGPDLLAGVMSETEVRERVRDLVAQELSAVLRCDSNIIDPQSPFASLGLDSLMALELRNRLERASGVQLPVTVIWSSPTVEQLAESLLGAMRPDEQQPADGPVNEPAISDEDAQMILDLAEALRGDEGG